MFSSVAGHLSDEMVCNPVAVSILLVLLFFFL
jgi:hypothetical protein